MSKSKWTDKRLEKEGYATGLGVRDAMLHVYDQEVDSDIAHAQYESLVRALRAQWLAEYLSAK